MYKEKLFKLLFPLKYSEIKMLRAQAELYDAADCYEDEEKPSLSDLMRESLGLPMLDFTNADKEGRPPHYLDELKEDARKNFIAELESIYSNEKFQTIVHYAINLIGNNVMLKVPDDKIPNGRIAIVGIKTLLNEFEKAHGEYLSSRQKPEEFDPLEPLPG